jgi:hypothetical protein
LFEGVGQSTAPAIFTGSISTYAFGNQVLEDLIHHRLVGGRTIGEAKVHD